MQEQVTIYTDGASRGNPGPGAAAFVLTNTGGKIIGGKGFFLGKTTNNAAEYMGLLQGLLAARELGIPEVRVFSDSELMVRQINGEYKVKSKNLKDIFRRCAELAETFKSFEITHILRDKNQQADDLANRAMDIKKDVDLAVQSGSANSKKVRLGILLSGGGRTMVNIHNQIEAGKLNAQIVLVICSRSKIKGVERARKIGIEPIIIRKKDLPDIDEFSKRIESELVKAKVELVIQAGWLCLWKIPLQYNRRVMNIHPALLPSFGGQGMWGHHVHEAVLEAGCKVSGCTVHFCTNEYDKGQILVQKVCNLEDDDDADSLAARVFEQECIAYSEAIRMFSESRIAKRK